MNHFTCFCQASVTTNCDFFNHSCLNKPSTFSVTLKTDIPKSPKTFLRKRVCCRFFINCRWMKVAGPVLGTVLSKFRRCDWKSPQFTQVIKHNHAKASAVSWSCQAPDNQRAPMVKHCARVCVHANAVTRYFSKNQFLMPVGVNIPS